MFGRRDVPSNQNSGVKGARRIGDLGESPAKELPMRFSVVRELKNRISLDSESQAPESKEEPSEAELNLKKFLQLHSKSYLQSPTKKLVRKNHIQQNKNSVKEPVSYKQDLKSLDIS